MRCTASRSSSSCAVAADCAVSPPAMERRRSRRMRSSSRVTVVRSSLKRRFTSTSRAVCSSVRLSRRRTACASEARSLFSARSLSSTPVPPARGIRCESGFASISRRASRRARAASRPRTLSCARMSPGDAPSRSAATSHARVEYVIMLPPHQQDPSCHQAPPTAHRQAPGCPARAHAAPQRSTRPSARRVRAARYSRRARATRPV